MPLCSKFFSLFFLCSWHRYITSKLISILRDNLYSKRIKFYIDKSFYRILLSPILFLKINSFLKTAFDFILIYKINHFPESNSKLSKYNYNISYSIKDYFLKMLKYNFLKIFSLYFFGGDLIGLFEILWLDI